MKKCVLLCLVMMGAIFSIGAIYPTLQPDDLYKRHRIVLVGEVASVDAAGHSFVIEVKEVCKGEFKPGGVQVRVEGKGLPAFTALTMAAAIVPKEKVVGFIGQMVVDEAGTEMLLYLADGFHKVRIEGGTTPQWVWYDEPAEQVGTDGQTLNGMIGVWNGAASGLADMVHDMAAGEDFFPRKAYVRFQKDLVLANLGGPVRSVSIHDIDGSAYATAWRSTPPPPSPASTSMPSTSRATSSSSTRAQGRSSMSSTSMLRTTPGRVCA